MGRSRHSKKDVEKALRIAEAAGFAVTSSASGHRWGVIDCGHGCTHSVWSTPRNPVNHAKQLIRTVERCEHKET